jgi:ADP-ribose pyrophosphatase YjhB (NUDIX family)
MNNLFKHKESAPFHISVGAVLVNNKGKILTHKRTTETTPKEFLHTMGGLSETYILMRESLEDNETLENAVHRGLQEEFGAEGKIRKYLGAIFIPALHAKTRIFEKTTLYFKVELIRIGERPMDDGESHTELVWMEPKELLIQMRNQGSRTEREDLDESKIIESYLKYGA